MNRPDPNAILRRHYADHRRDWRDNYYVYPVISRRSKGLSIGINLNPDKACNFDCIYCQVDRTTPPAIRQVDLEILQSELEEMFQHAASGELFRTVQFGAVPVEMRAVRDIAFSGDGEPTTCPQFSEAVQQVIALKQQYELHDTKIVLITDACYLTRPAVAAALVELDHHQGEIWAKLDAGTEEYYRLVNQPNYPLAHVLKNITTAARQRPLVIQSLFMRIDGVPPSATEIDAYCSRLQGITAAGGQIKLVQVYTIARRPPTSRVTPLSNTEVDTLANHVQKNTRLPTESFYGVQID
ncbi:MAG: hypothetical protein HJJLKODD_02034 [Phycisphaerae bacterium]|nr:hypothetical protein [Phycisphaerae bacterium]